MNPPPGERVEKGSWLVPVTLGVVGIGGLVVGGAMGVASGSTKDELGALQAARQCGVNAPACEDVRSRGTTQSTVSVVGYVAGGAFLAGAVVSALVLKPWQNKVRTGGTLVPYVAGDGFGAAYSASF